MWREMTTAPSIDVSWGQNIPLWHRNRLSYVLLLCKKVRSWRSLLIRLWGYLGKSVFKTLDYNFTLFSYSYKNCMHAPQVVPDRDDRGYYYFTICNFFSHQPRSQGYLFYDNCLRPSPNLPWQSCFATYLQHCINMPSTISLARTAQNNNLMF